MHVGPFGIVMMIVQLVPDLLDRTSRNTTVICKPKRHGASVYFAERRFRISVYFAQAARCCAAAGRLMAVTNAATAATLPNMIYLRLDVYSCGVWQGYHRGLHVKVRLLLKLIFLMTVFRGDTIGAGGSELCRFALNMLIIVIGSCFCDAGH